MTLSQIEASIYNKQIQIEQEQFRRESWESLKNFRSKYDNEYNVSESVMDKNEIDNLKREVDKLLLNAIRITILKEEAVKVMFYLEMVYFSQTLKLCVKLCEQLKSPDMAQKVNKFLQDKDTKDLFLLN